MTSDELLRSLRAQIDSHFAGAPVVPPVIPPTTPLPPPVQPPAPPAPPAVGGNPGAIVPVWDPGVMGLVKNDIRMASGQIAAFPVPMSAARSAVTFSQGQTANTAPKAFTEFQVSRVPGVIEVNGPNYQASPFINNNTMEVYSRLPAGFTPEMLRERGFAYAPVADGPWYINVRWTHAAASCGFAIKWIDGGSY